MIGGNGSYVKDEEIHHFMDDYDKKKENAT